MKMENLPKIKSVISSFFLGEEGKISKQSILSLGAMFVGSVAVADIAQAATNCEMEFSSPNTEIGRCVHSSSGGCGGCGLGGLDLGIDGGSSPTPTGPLISSWGDSDLSEALGQVDSDGVYSGPSHAEADFSAEVAAGGNGGGIGGGNGGGNGGGDIGCMGCMGCM